MSQFCVLGSDPMLALIPGSLPVAMGSSACSTSVVTLLSPSDLQPTTQMGGFGKADFILLDHKKSLYLPGLPFQHSVLNLDPVSACPSFPAHGVQ